LSEDLQRIFEFIIELDNLKAVLRKTKPVGVERYENSAEHSWQVCLLAQLLAQHAKEPIDIVRVVEILLVHDIPEIDAGDQIVYQGQSEARAASELQAAQRIFGLLPEPQASWCMARWQEYEARESKEAIYAYAIDRLMPLLQNLKNNGQSWRENKVPLEKVLAFNSAIGKACPAVWEYAQELIAQAAREGVFEHEKQDA
jgi:putative hydrolase of HD superfamily